ncbi:MAG: PQQ-binding-like beta-propeller repeat protein [Vicinamibacterales bacterium]|jgi:outer membrane protein assembly factor BamB|nr:PQQ-binding-like beta-propeller repeat protein [Vicinamibacterales bacterium]MDP7691421.1 PQQ-binding-like beta-propeller repeat protein [Vicinamibacterales bacterium]HJN42568.1 PQQ-binding-like beta-propeller repeat protein [Vicinamibacterales bacterium]|tara:strand:- start:527 stop:1972 length:1446 start_codon:yes stop_codon:yes gene_type:complete
MRRTPARSVGNTILLVALIGATTALSVEAQNWPSFRGADALPIADDDPRLPLTWSTTENVVWKTPVDGLGWSSPVVWGNRIFLTTVVSDGESKEPRMGLYFPFGSPQDSDDGRFPDPGPGDLMEREEDIHHWVVYALDFDTGQVVWTQEVNSGAPQFDRHLKNTFASSTPVTDGERVYAYFGNVGVFAFDMDGGLAWERRFEPADTRLGWGPAASPVLHDGTLFIVNDNDAQSFVTAIDAATGDERWRVDRNEGTNWSTPFVWQHDERPELVTAGSDEVRSYDLEGNELWHFRGLNSISIPQPFSANGLLYVTSGYVGDATRPVFAIRPGAQGDITLQAGQRSNDAVVWYRDAAGPYHPTPLVFGNWYFTLLDQGFFTVHDARTGEELYFTEQQVVSQEVRRRVARGTGGFTASPWAYNDKIFVLSEDGDTYVLDTADDFNVVATNSLGEVAMSSPAIARGSLFIRTRSHLWRLTDTSRSR